MLAVVDRVEGVVATASVMTAKTKLGGLVRHQRVRATGVDLTLTLCRVDRGGGGGRYLCQPAL